MIGSKFGQAIALALCLKMGAVGGAFAHALPGSVLVFQAEDDTLTLRVEFPLEDLIIALPDVAALEDAPMGPLPDAMQDQLAAYFAEHLELARGDDVLPLTLQSVRLDPASNHHVGGFTLVISTFETPVTDPPFPMALRYSAVMHEVRSQRATRLLGKRAR